MGEAGLGDLPSNLNFTNNACYCFFLAPTSLQPPMPCSARTVGAFRHWGRCRGSSAVLREVEGRKTACVNISIAFLSKRISANSFGEEVCTFVCLKFCSFEWNYLLQLNGKSESKSCRCMKGLQEP